jgi:hypothetical protein
VGGGRGFTHYLLIQYHTETTALTTCIRTLPRYHTYTMCNAFLTHRCPFLSDVYECETCDDDKSAQNRPAIVVVRLYVKAINRTDPPR